MTGDKVLKTEKESQLINTTPRITDAISKKNKVGQLTLPSELTVKLAMPMV